MLRAVALLTLFVGYAKTAQKYPYVFLLDIGNEELRQTNEETIRVKVTGSSLALRYPAIGEGNTISHLRVSGVDFGADLKATIVDGGPGYKYAVLALVGNKNIPYDVVISIKTMIDDDESSENDYEEEKPTMARSVQYSESDGHQPNFTDKSNNEVDTHDHSEDYNNEDADQNFNNKIYQKNSYNRPINTESKYTRTGYGNSRNIVQPNPGSIIYLEKNYIPLPPRFYPTPMMKSMSPQLFHPQYEPRFINKPESRPNQHFISPSGEPINELPKPEPILSGGFAKTIGDVQPVEVVDKNVYDRYQALSPHLPEDISVYSHETSQDVDEQRSWEAPKAPLKDDAEVNQMFNDEEVHADAGKYQNDSNSKYYTGSGDASAVAYR